MTEIPISSDVINVESCNKDFLEALERLFHLAYNNLMFDLIKVQRLRNLTFDLGSGKTEVLIFFQTFFTKTLNLHVFIHQVYWSYYYMPNERAFQELRENPCCNSLR